MTTRKLTRNPDTSNEADVRAALHAAARTRGDDRATMTEIVCALYNLGDNYPAACSVDPWVRELIAEILTAAPWATEADGYWLRLEHPPVTDSHPRDYQERRALAASRDQGYRVQPYRLTVKTSATARKVSTWCRFYNSPAAAAADAVELARAERVVLVSVERVTLCPTTKG